MRVLIVLFLLLSSCLSAQNSLLQGLNSSGDLPKEFYSNSFTDYLAQKELIEFEKPRKSRLIEKQFYLESNYWIYDIQYSGKVIFGGPLTSYVNRVADKLLAGNKELRSQLNFYVIKSSSLNAFASQQGNIYVNLGLLARVKSEAALAYILSHEIVHYQKKHAVKGYVKQMDAENAKELENKLLYQDSVIRIHNYSQSLEFDADTTGLDMFAASGYDITEAIQALECLKKADQTALNVPFSRNIFRVDGQEISPKPMPVSGDSLNAKNSDVSESTHPEIESRIKVIEQKIAAKYKQRALKIQVAETNFKEIQNRALYCMVEVLLEERQYKEAMFHTDNLLVMHGQDPYLESSLCKAFHAYTILRNRHLLINQELFPSQSEAAKFRNDLINYPNDTLLAIDLWNTYNGFKKAQGDQHKNLEYIFCNALREVRHFGIDFMAEGIQGLSDSLKKKEPVLLKNILIKILSDNEVKGLAGSESTFDVKSYHSGMKLAEYNRVRQNQIKYPLYQGGVLAVDCRSVVVDLRLDFPLDYEKSGYEESKWIRHITHPVFEKKYNFSLLSPYNRKGFTTEKYNDHNVLAEVIDDCRYFHNGFTMQDRTTVVALKQKYNVQYLLSGFSLCLVEHENMDEFEAFFYSLVPGALPLIIRKQEIGRNANVIVFSLTDLDNLGYYLPYFKPASNKRNSKYAYKRLRSFLAKIKSGPVKK